MLKGWSEPLACGPASTEDRTAAMSWLACCWVMSSLASRTGCPRRKHHRVAVIPPEEDLNEGLPAAEQVGCIGRIDRLVTQRTIFGCRGEHIALRFLTCRLALGDACIQSTGSKTIGQCRIALNQQGADFEIDILAATNRVRNLLVATGSSDPRAGLREKAGGLASARELRGRESLGPQRRSLGGRPLCRGFEEVNVRQHVLDIEPQPAGPKHLGAAAERRDSFG